MDVVILEHPNSADQVSREGESRDFDVPPESAGGAAIAVLGKEGISPFIASCFGALTVGSEGFWISLGGHQLFSQVVDNSDINVFRKLRVGPGDSPAWASLAEALPNRLLEGFAFFWSTVVWLWT